MLEPMKTRVGFFQQREVSKLINNPLNERTRLIFTLPECNNHSDCGNSKEFYHGTDTWYSVNWPVGDTTWKDTEEWFKDVTGIYCYKVIEQSQPRIYQYAIYISVVDGGSGFGRMYTFEDQEGGEYSLTAFLNGDHSVNYDSNAPRIKWV